MARGLCIVMGVLASWMVLATPALAGERNEVLAVTSESPASGATVAPGAVSFEVSSPQAHLSGMELEVSTSTLPGQDGTLADDFRKELLFLHESDAFPGKYRGEASYFPSISSWDATPGTYYWQVSATEYELSPPFEIIHYISPVFTLTIASPTAAPAPTPTLAPTSEAEEPAPPTLTLYEARRAVPRAIKHRTGHTPHILKNICTKISSAESVCHASWYAPYPATSHSWLYTGHFDFEAQEGETIAYTFKGAKAELGCLKHHRVAQCARLANW